MAKKPTATLPAPIVATDVKVPAQTTVEAFVERALNHNRGAATYGGMIRFVLTEWAKKNPAPQDAHLFR